MKNIDKLSELIKNEFGVILDEDMIDDLCGSGRQYCVLDTKMCPEGNLESCYGCPYADFWNQEYKKGVIKNGNE